MALSSRFPTRSLALVSCLLGSGCYTAELDPAIEGVFGCDVDEDCPEGLLCDGLACVSETPSVQVSFPEDLQVFTDGSAVAVVVRGTGLSLTSPGDGAAGEGFLRVTLDGQTIDVTAGALSGGITVEGFATPTEPGGHRISVQAVRPDGSLYENEDALATRLFWIDDGQPHIAFTKPWPGATFDLDSPEVEFEVAALNFLLGPSDLDLEDGVGHVHVYYDAQFPGCADNPACDSGYIAVAAPTLGEGQVRIAGTVAPLPASSESTVSLTGVLRQNNHEPFSRAGEDEDLDLVTDDLPISRVQQ